MSVKHCVLASIVTSMVLGISFYTWRMRSKPLVWPVTQENNLQNLRSSLEKENVSFDGQIGQLGETITASISGMSVYFNGSKDLNQEVRALQLLLPRLKMEERKPREIDLRFNKVIIRY